VQTCPTVLLLIELGWSGLLIELGWSGLLIELGWSGLLIELGWSGLLMRFHALLLVVACPSSTMLPSPSSSDLDEATTSNTPTTETQCSTFVGSSNQHGDDSSEAAHREIWQRLLVMRKQFTSKASIEAAWAYQPRSSVRSA
jgi:hypothetical protein